MEVRSILVKRYFRHKASNLNIISKEYCKDIDSILYTIKPKTFTITINIQWKKPDSLTQVETADVLQKIFKRTFPKEYTRNSRRQSKDID